MEEGDCWRYSDLMIFLLQANLGHLDSSAQRRDVILSNLALIQIQATVIAFLASAFAMALAWIPRGQVVTILNSLHLHIKITSKGFKAILLQYRYNVGLRTLAQELFEI